MAYSNMDEDNAASGMADRSSDGDGGGEPMMEEGGETSLLPRSFFAGKELTPGKECKVKIVAVHGDDVEVEYVPHDEGDETEAGGMDGARSRMNMAADGGKAMAGGGGGGGGGGY